MIKNNFNGGIFGQKLRYRADLEKYFFSVADLENFYVLPYGGIENRTGTLMLKQYADNNLDIRLVPFQFNHAERFILAFSVGNIDIFDAVDNVLVYSISSPYENIWELNFEQKNDIIWIVSQNYSPKILKRYDNENWVLEDFKLKNIPFYTNMDNNIHIWMSEVNNDRIEISSDGNIFTPKMVGATIRIFSLKKNLYINKTFKADGESDYLEIFGPWHLVSTGTWVGTVLLERSFDNGETWEEYRQYSSNANNNIDDSGYEQEFGVIYRCSFVDWEDASAGVLYECRITLIMDNGQTFNDAVISEFVDESTVKCIAEKTFNRIENTADWSISAWNNEYGYPKCVAFTSGDRLCFANTKKQPQTIWMSQVGNYDNFYNDVQEDSALTWTIETTLYNEINWIINKKKLLLGLANQIGSISGQDPNRPLTITNKYYEQEIEISAANIPPVKVNDCMLLLRRGKKSLLELSYNWESEGFVAPDMTLLAPEVLQGRVRQMAYQEQPYPLVWFVMEDGTCATFTYNRQENITAWAKQKSAGEFLSVVALGNENHDDDVYVAIRRANGVFIEHFSRRDDMVFSDCSVVFESDSGMADIENISVPHLKNQNIVMLLDGSPWHGKTDENGDIILPFPAQKIVAGLSYESYMESLPFEMMQGVESTLANKKIAQNIILKFHNSIGGELSLDGKFFSPVISRRTSDILGESLQPENYTANMLLRSTFQYETIVYLRQKEPLPLTLLAYELDVMQG